MASRNEIEIVLKADDKASGVLEGFLGRLGNTGQSLMRTGAAITAATAPIALAFGVALSSAVAFDSSMTNVAAVMGKSRSEMTALNKEVLRIGANSRAGPQMAAEAFYDIVGGVADADAHIAILEASIRTAEAGSAELGSTTNALVAVMNSYKFGAEDAAYASDVLTRTVGMGVGTMEDFASALPAITGLAKSLNISFGDLAASTAYLTTQGNTASQATTQLSAMMTSMLNPNEQMKKAIQELGFANGQAAVEQLGLVGAMNALKDTSVANTSGLAAMLGSTEALRGVTALAGPEFAKFAKDFTDGITGATAAAQAIQLHSPAAQMDLFNSKMSALGITIGMILIPPLLDLSGKMMPIVDSVLAWAQANPELMTTIVGIGLAALAAGPVIGLMGTAMTLVSTAVGVLLAPAFLLAGAIAAIVAAAQIGYPGGIVGLFNAATTAAQQLAFLGLFALNAIAQTARQGLINLAAGLSDAFNKAVEFGRGILGLTLAGGAFIALLTQSKLAVTAWTLATSAAQAISATATAIWGFMSGSLGILTGALGAGSAGMGAFAASAALAAAPIIAVGIAIAGVIAQISEFNRVSGAGRSAAQTTAAQGLASGQINQQDIYDQAFKSAQAEHGDLFARFFYSNIANDVIGGANDQIAGQRAHGGSVIGGRSYLIGERGPEIWTPPANGTIGTNNQLNQMTAAGAGAGGGGINFNGPITVYGNTEAEGRDAARGFVQELNDLLRANG